MRITTTFLTTALIVSQATARTLQHVGKRGAMEAPQMMQRAPTPVHFGDFERRANSPFANNKTDSERIAHRNASILMWWQNTS
jgi:hypothetical protein